MSGLAIVGEEDVKGISVSGLAIVSGKNLGWISATLGAIYAQERIDGFAFGGFRVESDECRGLTASLIQNRIGDMRGLMIGGYNNIGVQHGIAIGLINRADELHGLQIGLINSAGNNRKGWQTMPILNFHR